jgi:hypothetical protein
LLLLFNIAVTVCRAIRCQSLSAVAGTVLLLLLSLLCFNRFYPLSCCCLLCCLCVLLLCCQKLLLSRSRCRGNNKTVALLSVFQCAVAMLSPSPMLSVAVSDLALLLLLLCCCCVMLLLSLSPIAVAVAQCFVACAVARCRSILPVRCCFPVAVAVADRSFSDPLSLLNLMLLSVAFVAVAVTFVFNRCPLSLCRSICFDLLSLSLLS